MSTIDLRDADTTGAEHREFWRRVLRAGGVSALPRWTSEPGRGIGYCEARVPDDVRATLLRLAGELDVSLRSVVLTAHAKVLAALSGDREVSTGYVARKGDAPRLCRMTTEPHTWRSMLVDTHRAERDLLSHADFPVEDLARELGLSGSWFETVFDPTSSEDGEPAEDVVLRVAILEHDGIVIRLGYRRDALDAGCAARIAGYHLSALASIAADVDAEHARQSLLSSEELHFQLHGLAGPRREVPDHRVHEIFEERVRLHPDAVAAAQGDRPITYDQL